MGNIRVLLADDHETVREGLRAILSADPDITVVGEAADGESAVAGARAIQPNIVVMDVTMPGLNGFQATQTIKESCPGTQVVVLTRHAHEAIASTLDVSVKTIEAHKANAAQKLGLQTRADVVRYAHMRGWLTDI